MPNGPATTLLLHVQRLDGESECAGSPRCARHEALSLWRWSRTGMASAWRKVVSHGQQPRATRLTAQKALPTCTLWRWDAAVLASTNRHHILTFVPMLQQRKNTTTPATTTHPGPHRRIQCSPVRLPCDWVFWSRSEGAPRKHFLSSLHVRTMARPVGRRTPSLAFSRLVALVWHSKCQHRQKGHKHQDNDVGSTPASS